MKYLFYLLILGIVIFSCGPKSNVSISDPISHQLWSTVLDQYIDERGMVNYKGIKKDSTLFYQYLKLLSEHHPNDQNWTKSEQLAYWINAYNAFTVQLIIENYPIKSIKKIKSIEIPFLHSIWNKEFIEIESIVYSLNDIEHEILRKQFDDPRIHFAINCASISCPSLSGKAYEASIVEEQLEESTRRFFVDKSKNRIEKNKVSLSKILKWFESDFTKEGNIIQFINSHSDIIIGKDASIEYLDYNWLLNEQFEK